MFVFTSKNKRDLKIFLIDLHQNLLKKGELQTEATL